MRRVRKGPIAERAQVDRLVASAAKLSREHWEVVTILLRTGIELEALSHLTWRDLSKEQLTWRRPLQGDSVAFSLDDPELREAAWGYIRRPRRSADQLDRLVRQVRKAAGGTALEGVTALSLRLTRCRELLLGGMDVEAVSKMLAIKPSVVEQVAHDAGLSREGAKPPSSRKRPSGPSS